MESHWLIGVGSACSDGGEEVRGETKRELEALWREWKALRVKQPEFRSQQVRVVWKNWNGLIYPEVTDFGIITVLKHEEKINESKDELL